MKPAIIVGNFTVILSLVVCSGAGAWWSRGEVRITPFLGYTLGGEFHDYYDPYYCADINLDNGPTWGVRFGVGLGGSTALEFSFAHMMSEFYSGDPDGFFGEDYEKICDADLFILQMNLLFDLGRDPVSPYFTFGMGATQFEMDRGTDETRFTVNMAGGLNVKINAYMHIRSELRGYLIYIESGDYYDDYYYDCDDWEYLYNLEATLGLSFRI
ncbi:outer membrane beta-barrel protein [bacterium]|nr:outer membrane beta-barrel protein [candidate division CSSED10-310 bacterium]